ncbi:L,D-transpeptidase [Mesorhizobium sp. BAC0120]|uniref:L,D-transpeptidase n=1 Tax=Mesorhizobium sp. BAC0120 TaxID=3090670 RepID=UPI00298C0D2C|nr:L,D-transpeptidase [Mesorhizobium sp. BAC0120]MDW6022838.1 L,D-transpeptidase [Mesorhizobium sp. BAC0120]
MKFRSLLLLGIGAAIACAPAFAAGTTADTGKTEVVAAATQSVAALEAATSKTDPATEKKLKAKSASKKNNKKLAKAKNKAGVEEAKEEEKPRGLFAALFGGGLKQAPSKEDGKEKAKLVATVAKTKAEPETQQPQPIQVSITGNKGELRSENLDRKPDIFASLFGGTSRAEMLPETRALDSVLEERQTRKKFKVRAEFEPQEVEFPGYAPGTIVIDTSAKFLYLIEDRSTARRYAIAVGREGLQFKGSVTVGDKQEWPRWIPTKEMQQREPKKYGQYKDGMDGGPDNPLGARAIYLYQGKQDTHLRIHGTNQPQSIGSAASNGCFRMINDHVMDLYRRVKLGTPVVVL